MVEVEAAGPRTGAQAPFSARTVRFNPAQAGAVTGNATFASFLSSLLHFRRLGNGIHFC